VRFERRVLSDVVLGLVDAARALGNGKIGHIALSFGGNYSAMTGLTGVADAAVDDGGPVKDSFTAENLARLPCGGRTGEPQALSASVGSVLAPGSAQARTISSRDSPRAAARVATVKNAGVAMRPVSILRNVSAGTPERAAISAMLRGPRAARKSRPSRSPRA
jgi:hypothetical protein